MCYRWTERERELYMLIFSLIVLVQKISICFCKYACFVCVLLMVAYYSKMIQEKNRITMSTAKSGSSRQNSISPTICVCALYIIHSTNGRTRERVNKGTKKTHTVQKSVVRHLIFHNQLTPGALQPHHQRGICFICFYCIE